MKSPDLKEKKQRARGGYVQSGMGTFASEGWNGSDVNERGS